jgi:tetratricopeptide (TPR) repeat protein
LTKQTAQGRKSATPPALRRPPVIALGLAAALLAFGCWLGARASRPHSRVAPPAAPLAKSITAVLPAETSIEEQKLLAAVAQHPRDARAREQLGSYYVGTGKPFTGLWRLQEARALDPHDLKTGLGIATALEAGRFPDAALAELRALLKRYPGRVEICRRVADILLATGRPQEAAAALTTATELSRSPEALIVLARARQSMRQFDAAEKAMRQAQLLVPGRPEPQYYLGRLYLDRGDTAKAERAFLAARYLKPDLAEPHYGLGLTYLQRAGPKDATNAEAAFRAAVERSPDHAGARRELGRLYLKRRRYPQAAEQFVGALRASRDAEACRGMAEALAAMGRSVESKYHWGLYYTRKDLRPRSAVAFREMSSLDPGRKEAVLLLTEAYFRMKQQERAVPLVEASLQRFPGDPVLLERLAVLSVANLNPPAAVKACREWLDVEPKAAKPHWIMGRLALDNQRVDEAIQELEQAVALDPNDPEFAVALARALQQRPTPENQRRVGELLAAAVRRGPDVPGYRDRLGQFLRDQGDLEGARREFLAALDRNPHEPPVYTNLVAVARQTRRPHQVRLWSPLVRIVQNRTREEMRLWRRAWDRPQEAAACYDLARFLIRTGELTKAESQLEEALRLRPGWIEARQSLTVVRDVRYATGS